jgi:rhamnose utilization protein RhaD (predicted bifunctional aldolase and dehydrogenase)
MKSLWDDSDAKKFGNDALGRRVYTSRLIGAESELVLHGGGNTSVKVEEENLFGDREAILYCAAWPSCRASLTPTWCARSAPP